MIVHTLTSPLPCVLQHELKDMLNVQEGHIFDYQDIVDDRRKLEM